MKEEARGKLTVIHGPMFAGKTTELINKIKETKEAGYKVLTFKSSLDTRYNETKIISHDGEAVDSIPLTYPSELELYMANSYLKNNDDNKYNYELDKIFIDEIHFFDRQIVDKIDKILSLGIDVIVAGLSKDYKNKPFKATQTLIEKADEVIPQTAICKICGAPAEYTYKKSNTSDRIEVGAADIYEARCKEHWSF